MHLWYKDTRQASWRNWMYATKTPLMKDWRILQQIMRYVRPYNDYLKTKRKRHTNFCGNAVEPSTLTSD
jgi:hypothetical protein